jgi:hypothetical protein
MCKWVRGIAWTSDATNCTGGAINTGSGASGFVESYYWSSSENSSLLAWYLNFNEYGIQREDSKEFGFCVRPVRAF